MNLKNNKGITMISLIITIIILAVLTYSAVHISISMTDTARFENVEANMLMIQSACEIRENEITLKNTENRRFGELVEEGEYAGLYRLTQRDLAEIGIKTGNSVMTPQEAEKVENKKSETGDVYYVQYPEKDEDGYIIGDTEIDVIYEKGVVNSGLVYHKLSDILKLGDQND